MKKCDDCNMPLKLCVCLSYGDDIFQRLAKEWLDKGGKNDVEEFAKWLEKNLEETFN